MTISILIRVMAGPIDRSTPAGPAIAIVVIANVPSTSGAAPIIAPSSPLAVNRSRTARCRENQQHGKQHERRDEGRLSAREALVSASPLGSIRASLPTPPPMRSRLSSHQVDESTWRLVIAEHRREHVSARDLLDRQRGEDGIRPEHDHSIAQADELFDLVREKQYRLARLG